MVSWFVSIALDVDKQLRRELSILDRGKRMPDRDEVTRTFADRLRQDRNALQLTRRELARRAEVDAASLAAYESGEREPALGAAVRVALALGRPLTDLAPWSAAPEPREIATDDPERPGVVHAVLRKRPRPGIPSQLVQPSTTFQDNQADF